MTERIKLTRASARKPNGNRTNGHAKWTVASAARLINGEWRKQVPSIVATGKNLIKMKKALGHGNWQKLVGSGPRGLVPGKLDFGPRVAQMLMKIAKNPVLSNPQNFAHLPPQYPTLDALDAFAPDLLQVMIDSGEVHPALKLGEARALSHQRGGAEDFAKGFANIVRYLAREPEPDDDDVGDAAFLCARELGVTVAELQPLAAEAVSRLEGLFGRMEELRLEREYGGTGLTERDGRRCFKVDRVIAAPEPDASTPPRERKAKAPPPKQSGNGAASTSTEQPRKRNGAHGKHHTAHRRRYKAARDSSVRRHG